LTPFGFGFGPGFQLDVFDVDAQGQVFAQAIGAAGFGGTPFFLNSDLIFSNLKLLNGLLYGSVQNQGNANNLLEIVNFSNAFVLDALLAAIASTPH